MVQDVVTRGGKFFFLYKRPGNRVIVNDGGHMMVSPSAIEASVQQSIAGVCESVLVGCSAPIRLLQHISLGKLSMWHVY